MKKEALDNYEIESRKKNKALVFNTIIFISLALVIIIFVKQKYDMDKERMNIVKQEENDTEALEPTPVPTLEPTPKAVKVKNTTKTLKLLQEHTVYHYSSYNRDNNLSVAAKMLSNTVVLPGEEFSFFGVIGNPNAEKGFKEAGVIVNHQSATALGGGICEVATSLNTVVVNAGLKTNAQSHSLNVGYLNSTDHEATVTYDGGIDLKFTNTLKYPIMIKQSVSGGNVTTKLFKAKEIKRITFKNPINKQKTRKSYAVKKMLAQNTKAQTEFDLKLNKVKYYYLNSNDFFEMSRPKVKKSKRILRSLMKAAVEANLEIDRGIGDKKLAVKNTEQFPILVEISYNSKGDVRTEIFKLKEK